MGAGSSEKDLRLARIAFVGALRRLDAVMAKVERSDIQLWPDADGNAPTWSVEHLALMKAAAEAWADLVRRRQDYDSAARTAAQPSTWPHS